VLKELKHAAEKRLEETIQAIANENAADGGGDGVQDLGDVDDDGYNDGKVMLRGETTGRQDVGGGEDAVSRGLMLSSVASSRLKPRSVAKNKYWAAGLCVQFSLPIVLLMVCKR
jgi:hypothetical protein